MSRYKMKKGKSKLLLKCLAVLLAAVLCAALSGCDIVKEIKSIDERFNDVRYNKHYTNMWELILSALDNRDREALKSLFSDDTAALADFDEKLDEFMDFYKGSSIKSTNMGGLESGIHGATTEYVEKNYCVTTDENSYSITFCYTMFDPPFEEQSGNEGKISGKTGINSILILTQELEDEAFFTQWPPSDGVFVLYTLDDCITTDD